MPVIPALRRLRQEDRCEFETSLGYKSEFKVSLNCIMRPCLKKDKEKKITKHCSSLKLSSP